MWNQKSAVLAGRARGGVSVCGSRLPALGAQALNLTSCRAQHVLSLVELLTEPHQMLPDASVVRIGGAIEAPGSNLEITQRLTQIVDEIDKDLFV